MSEIFFKKKLLAAVAISTVSEIFLKKILLAEPEEKGSHVSGSKAHILLPSPRNHGPSNKLHQLVIL